MKPVGESSENIEANSTMLIQSLGRFGTVDQTDRGIVLTLDESYWSGIRVSSFADANSSKLDELGTILSNSPSYSIRVESHTDDRGEADQLSVLTSERAQAIADKLISGGVSGNRLETKGYGSAAPIVSNATRANRAKNRRVQLILRPNVN